MPTPDWFGGALIIAVTLYVLLAAVIIVGRIRYDRRRRLFERIAASVDAAAGRSAAPGLRARVLRASSLRAVELCVAEAHATEAVLRACAAYVLASVGTVRLVARASRHRRRWRRIAALRTLAFARADVAWALLDRALGDRDCEVVRAAVLTLGQIHERRSAELLVRALREGRHSRSATALSLHEFPSDISDLIAPLLVDRNPELRYWGAILAARHSSISDADARLATLASDVEPKVRAAALDSLGAAGFVSTVPKILARLDDPVPFVRACAAHALGQLGAIVAAAALGRRLADRDWSTRDAVKRSLEMLGNRVEPVLWAHLSDEDVFARNGAAEVLQHLGTFERLLLNEAAGPPDARRLAQLRRLADAGGRRVWDVVVMHRPEGARRRLASSVGMLTRLATISTEDLTA
jgi:HEAT repeat protein